MNIAAVIVAAGQGVRAGSEIPKQYSNLLGRPVLAWSVAVFQKAGVERIVVAVDPAHAAFARAALAGFKGVETVVGGATRTASVQAGLAALGHADVILIHDAARPGLTPEIIHALTDAIRAGAKAVAPALQVADALAQVDGETIRAEVDRASLRRVQTPQAFDGAALRNAYALVGDACFSDDLAVVRAAGVETRLIPGDIRLSKITYAEDRALLERLLSGERITCVGAGIDAHRFGAGDHVTLCGVKIAHDKGLVGHSDADAGWHALVDAILGALGEGDIGVHFPPSDPRWKDADSERFLRHAASLAQNAGARIVHVDITLVCENPKIGPHRDAMRARTADVLGLALSRVSVKATTTERMGFLGREEGLAAQATATLDRPA